MLHTFIVKYTYRDELHSLTYTPRFSGTAHQDAVTEVRKVMAGKRYSIYFSGHADSCPCVR